MIPDAASRSDGGVYSPPPSGPPPLRSQGPVSAADFATLAIEKLRAERQPSPAEYVEALSAPYDPETKIGLHPKQLAAYNSPATELLYGGAKGGGKSLWMRVCAISWCYQIPGLLVFIFRRTYPELEKSHMKGPRSLERMVQPLVITGQAKAYPNRVKFSNGSEIVLCHCQYEHTVSHYAGTEPHVLMIDQAEEFTDGMYRRLRGEVRMSGLEIPERLEGRFPRVVLSDNPGGVGDSWINENFIDPQPERQIWEGPAGMTRQFIPALLDDNPSLMKDDPGYERRLEDYGSPALVQALRWGKRGLIAGTFFGDVWNREDRQILSPFEIPAGWYRFASFDWGSDKPASLGVWAEADGSPCEIAGETWYLPKGSVVRLDELYTVEEHNGQIQHNVGRRLTNRELAREMASTLNGWPAEEIRCDPSIFSHHGAPSIADQIAEAADLPPLVGADNSRPSGWERMRGMMKESAKERPEGPGFYSLDTCRHFLRTVKGILRDPRKPGDARTDGEDHAVDEARYAVMPKPAPVGGGTWDPGW